MNRALYLLGLPLLLVACSKADGAELPPPTGAGAVPLPKLEKPAAAVEAKAGDPSRELIVTGTARPLHEAKLGPKVTGVVDDLMVEEGDRVKKGQVLFRLRSSAQDLGVKQAEAALQSALVQKSTADTELARTKALLDAGTVSPAVYDQVKGRADAIDAAVKQAEAAVNSARQSSADTVVTSPIAGVVSARRANVGETVTMMPPTTVLVIQDIDSLEVRASIPETALATVHEGGPVRIRFPALNTVRDVTITRINPSVDPITRTIEVVAVVPNADHALKAGMLVECDFRPEGQRAAAAPSAAAAASAAPSAAGAKTP